MIRQELLTLSDDDLISLSNRGVFKRAKREADGSAISGTIDSDEDGTITAVWSDKIECTFPPDKPIKEAICSCPAPPICRHLIRTILLYQQWVLTHPEQPTPALADTTHWHPADFDPALLSLHYDRLSTARNLFSSGLLIYLNLFPKPKAYIQTLGCTVQFLIPNDLHYAQCNCDELNKPCSHVPLAIWAFQQLKNGETAAVIETNAQPKPVNISLLDQIEAMLIEWLELGISTPNINLRQQWEEERKTILAADLIWPATILAELQQLIAQYSNRDALFDPDLLLQLWGELLIRLESMRQGTPNVPSLFVRGTEQDKELKIGKIHLTGLGTEAIQQKNSYSLHSYFQDNRTGNILTISHQFKERETEPQPPFWELATKKLIQKRSFQELSAAQLLAMNLKKQADGRLDLKRTKLSLTKQRIDWDKQLRPPLFIASFSELEARRQQQYPSALSPRQLGKDLAVLQIKEITQPAFNASFQMVTAILHDSDGAQIILKYPFQEQATTGSNGLLWWLTHAPTEIKYICGSINNGAQGTEIRPISLFIATKTGWDMFQPDIAHWSKEQSTILPTTPIPTPIDPIKSWLSQLNELLVQLLISGVKNPAPTFIRQLNDLIQLGESIGFVQLLPLVKNLHQQLSTAQHQLDWNWKEVIPTLFDLLRISRFSQDII